MKTLSASDSDTASHRSKKSSSPDAEKTATRRKRKTYSKRRTKSQRNGLEKQRAPKKLERWPFIRSRTFPSGAVSWMVDARTRDGGERRSFDSLAAAEGFADACRIHRKNEGLSAFGNPELAKFGKTVQDAVRFYLAHLKREEQSIPVKDAIDAFLV